jgi:hypothetical protein
METHTAEIRFDGDLLIPTYRVPVDAFRAQGQVVDRMCHNPNRNPAVEGPVIRVPTVRWRCADR